MLAVEAFDRLPATIIVRYGLGYRGSMALHKKLSIHKDLVYYTAENVWPGPLPHYYIPAWRDCIEGKHEQPNDNAYADLLTAKAEIVRLSAAAYFERHPPGAPFNFVKADYAGKPESDEEPDEELED